MGKCRNISFVKKKPLPYSLCDVSECVDCSPPDGLLVRLQEFKQLKTDPHPLSRRNVLRTYDMEI